ncbi:MAG: fluoride efflux transporter CrcB [bacterium]|nr:fluoride efflux transporter CrcB [bacterium]
MIEALWVGIGGFVGANARVLVNTLVTTRLGVLLPYGTFVVNVSGCFLIGLLVGAIEARVLSPAVRPLVITGFLGAYTTFSTFGIETVTLAGEGSLLLASVYVAASIVVGIAATVLGLGLGRALA